MAVDAMKAGVVDFIEKPFDDASLLAAVETARQRLAGEAGARAERENIIARVAQLTAREKDVFDAIVAGESNKSAGLKLGISPRTVEIYRANVMEKMRARSLSDLGAWKNSAASILRVLPFGPSAVSVAPSAIKAGPKLDALTKRAGPSVPKIA